MTIKTEVNIIRGITGILGLASLILILYFWTPIDFAKLLVAFGSLSIIWLIGYKLTNNKYIDNSENPRKTFWKLFRENELEQENLSNIPPLKHSIESFQDNYNFFDKNNKRKIRFCINQSFVRIQNKFGKFVSYSFNDIDNIYIKAHIDNYGDSGDIPRLSIEINLKNKTIDSCDIMKIDCEIDELEQIIEHFNKNTR